MVVFFFLCSRRPPISTRTAPLLPPPTSACSVSRRQNRPPLDRGFLFVPEDYLTREAADSPADIVDFRTGRPSCNSMQANMIVFSDFSGVDENGFPTFGTGLIAPNGQAIFAGQYGSEFAGVGIPLNTYNQIGRESCRERVCKYV